VSLLAIALLGWFLRGANLADVWRHVRTADVGLLFFEVTGQSSLLRHWLVAPAHRDQRIGARLMRRYFADCKDVRRFLLWVISDNHNAIDRYRHYGYQQDGLIDQVLIRWPS